jgi:hypothetical protein
VFWIRIRSGSRTSKLQEKPSAFKREHPALQNVKFLNFFQFLLVIFALLDPDPLTWLNPDPIRIRNNGFEVAFSEPVLYNQQPHIISHCCGSHVIDRTESVDKGGKPHLWFTLLWSCGLNGVSLNGSKYSPYYDTFLPDIIRMRCEGNYRIIKK